MYIKEVEDLINRAELKGCENLLVGDILHYDLNVQVTFKKCIKSIWCIIRDNYMENYCYEITGEPKIIMLFSNSYSDRKDLLKAFNKVCSTTNNIKVYPGKYHRGKNLHSFGIVIKWICSFRNLGIGLEQSIYFARLLHQAYCDYKRVEAYMKYKGIEIENALTVCDVMCIDSYFVQKWNSLGITTITLQHGTYNVGEYAYTHMKCDYLLTHSRFSANTAIISGVSEEKLVITGAPQNINTQYIEREQKYDKVIGLVFGGTRLQRYDVELLLMVKRLAEKKGYKIYIKLHPGFGVEQYEVDITNNVEKIYESEVDAYQFADMVGILIDTGSTLFVEYSVQGRTAFTYMSDVSSYTHDSNIKLGFRTYEELEKLILLYETDKKQLREMLRNNREYLGTHNDPYINYKDFFNKLINKE